MGFPVSSPGLSVFLFAPFLIVAKQTFCNTLEEVPDNQDTSRSESDDKEKGSKYDVDDGHVC